MSLLILDDQLDVQKILPGLKNWASTVRLQALRPGEHVLDDRVPELLLTRRVPTFVTLDSGFWKRSLCHARYCIVFVDVDDGRQHEIPGMLRIAFRKPELATTARRLGKVIRLSAKAIWFWEIGNSALNHLPLDVAKLRRRKRS